MVPSEIFKAVLPYLERRGIQVIALLGEGRLSPFAEKMGPADYLRENWAEKDIDFDVDKRSDDHDIRHLKAAMWKSSDAERHPLGRSRNGSQ